MVLSATEIVEGATTTTVGFDRADSEEAVTAVTDSTTELVASATEEAITLYSRMKGGELLAALGWQMLSVVVMSWK